MMSEKFKKGDEVYANGEHGRVEGYENGRIRVFRTDRGFPSLFDPMNIKTPKAYWDAQGIHGDARDALTPFQKALDEASVPARKRFEHHGYRRPFFASEWNGVHMAVEAQVVKAALDRKSLDKLVWQGLLDKIEEIAPFTENNG